MSRFHKTTDVANITPAELAERDLADPRCESSYEPWGAVKAYQAGRGGRVDLAGEVRDADGRVLAVLVEGVETLSDGTTVVDAGRVRRVESTCRRPLPPLADADLEAAGGAVLFEAVRAGAVAAALDAGRVAA